MSNINLNPSYPSQMNFDVPKKAPAKPEHKKISEKADEKPDASALMADKAYEEAIEKIKEFLEPQDVNVNLTYDSNTAIKNLILSDKETGQKIAELPPEGVVEMAEKAKIKNIGTLIDKMI